MRLRSLFSLLAVLALATFPAVSSGQFVAGPGNISGTGTVSIKRSPELLRMHVQLSSHGKDAKDSLTKLKARREAVVAKMVELGAKKEAIETGDPHVSVEDVARRRQMEMMVRERMRQQGRRGAKKEEAKPVTLTMDLKAEWPLKGENAEALLIDAYRIQELVRSEMAKLADSKEMSAEEEELAEEMQQMHYNDNEPKPGEPAFLYVARITDEERAKALASAFEKAKAQATELSKAANVKLGALEHLASNQAMNESPDWSGYPGYGGSRSMYRMMQQMQGSGEGPGEAIGADPGQVAISISVVASFGLKE